MDESTYVIVASASRTCKKVCTIAVWRPMLYLFLKPLCFEPPYKESHALQIMFSHLLWIRWRPSSYFLTFLFLFNIFGFFEETLKFFFSILFPVFVVDSLVFLKPSDFTIGFWEGDLLDCFLSAAPVAGVVSFDSESRGLNFRFCTLGRLSIHAGTSPPEEKIT